MPYKDMEKRRLSTRLRLKRLRESRGGAAAHNRLWKERNREKYLAHKSVENAIRSGAIKRQPCRICGSAVIVHAHHEDYRQPLVIDWLCPIHHKERHAELALGSAAPDLPKLGRGFGSGLFFNHHATPLTD